MASKKIVVDKITFLADALNVPRRSISMTAAAWARLFADVPDEIFEQAADVVAKTWQRNTLPPPGVIRDAIADIAIEKMGLPTALEAWHAVITAIKDGRASRIYKMPHPVPAIAECLGIEDLRWGDNMSALRAHFIDAYREEVRRMRRRINLNGGRAEDDSAKGSQDA